MEGDGFLGAGVVLRNPDKLHISGPATAATIGGTALFGVACGLSVCMPVGAAFVLGAIVMMFGGDIERTIHRRWAKQKDSAPRQP